MVREKQDNIEVRHAILDCPERKGFKTFPFYAIRALKVSVFAFRKTALQMGYYCRKQGESIILSRVRFSYLTYEKKHQKS